MTNKEKMLAGMDYFAADEELIRGMNVDFGVVK